MRKVGSYDTVLDSGNSVKLLLYLLDHGRIKAVQIREVISNYNTIVNVGRLLESNGLVKVSIVSEGRTVHYYELTERGEQVAKLLLEAVDIIEKDV